ncbi:MAG: hypothetical protein NVSMB64_03420 [Candidatus Velthaea sp.]
MPRRLLSGYRAGGGGYVELAVAFGVPRERIETIIDFAGAQKHGVKSDVSAAAATRETLASVANLVAWGEIVNAAARHLSLCVGARRVCGARASQESGEIALALDPAITEPIRPRKYPA